MTALEPAERPARHGVMPAVVASAFRRALAPLARTIAAAHVSANVVTAIGFAITVAGAVAVGLGSPLGGAVVLLVGTAFDALDGQVARAAGGGTKVGAFLDSTLDRVADAALMTAAIALGITNQDGILVVMGLVALTASFLVSYVRAKAESLGIGAEVGAAPREARIAIYIVGVAIWGLTGNGRFYQVALVAIAVLATLTLAERITHVVTTLQKEGN